MMPLTFFDDLAAGKMATMRVRAIVTAAGVSALVNAGVKVTQRRIASITGQHARTVCLAMHDLRKAGLVPPKRTNPAKTR
jgi:hypothetical protein